MQYSIILLNLHYYTILLHFSLSQEFLEIKNYILFITETCTWNIVSVSQMFAFVNHYIYQLIKK